MKRIEDIRLLVAGEEFTGWNSFQVETDFKQVADAFSMSAPNNRAELSGKFSPGASIKVVFGGRVVFVGVLDDVEYTGDADGERVSVTGRDSFAHLVDNSASPGTYRNINLLTLANTLSSDWNLVWSVQVGIALESHRSIKVEPGEAIMDVLLRTAKKDRVAIWFDSGGVANIGLPNYTQTPQHRIIYKINGIGNNAMSHSVSESWRDRYNSYTLDGTGKADSANWGKSTHRRAILTDAEVPSPRRLVLVDEVASIAEAKRQVEIEAENRAFDGLTLQYVVPGHFGDPYHAGDKPVLWDADQRVAVVDEPAGIDGVYWVSKRRWELSVDGLASTDVELHTQGWLA